MPFDRLKDEENVPYIYIYIYTHTMEYYPVLTKEWNIAICSNMDGSREYHTKWSKADRERQTLYVESKK